jgi:8-oxo-dGTP pyrophosphatase MutT (NUDIX family)
MPSLDWTLLDSRYVIHDQWFTLRADTYRLPDDCIIEPVYVIEYRPWVNIVALTRTQEAVLVRQFRPGLGRTILEIPGGSTDPGETSMLEAAQRELLEETGYAGTDWVAIGTIAPNPASHTNMMHCFLAQDVEQVCEPTPDDTEHLNVALVPLDDLVAMAKRGELVQALQVCSIFYALAHLAACRRGN